MWLSQRLVAVDVRGWQTSVTEQRLLLNNITTLAICTRSDKVMRVLDVLKVLEGLEVLKVLEVLEVREWMSEVGKRR